MLTHQPKVTLLDVVYDSAGCANDDVYTVSEVVDLRANRCAPVQSKGGEVRRHAVKFSFNLSQDV